MQEESKIALIVTSKVYYNNKAKKFKEYFLKNNLVYEVFDLSAVRRLVFENADNPGAILFFKVNIEGLKENYLSTVNHISLKQNQFFNKFSKNLIIEKFDIKQIQQKHFLENVWMFKVALYGNTLDYLFLNRISKFDNSIQNFIPDNYSVKSGNGIHKGTPKKHFNELIGIPIVETNNIQKYYTPINKFNKKLKKEDVFLEAGRRKSLFEGTKILLTRRPKKETNISVSICEENVVFRNSAYGIPLGNENKFIAQVYSYLNSSLYTYYQYLTSSNWGVYNPEINLNEYLSFPFKESNENQKLKLVSLVEKLLKPYKEFYQKYPNSVFKGKPKKEILDEINLIIEEVYEITGYEKDLIDYTLNVSRYQFQESKQHLVSGFNDADHRNKKEVLENYANVYIQEFEKIYDDEFIQVEIYTLDYFVAMNFVFLNEKPAQKIVYSKKKNEKQVLSFLANSLSISQITNANDSENNLFIQKDIKGFEKNSFYVIKPNEYKCWHRAMAWYDVAEFREEIQKAELERLNSDFDD